MRLYLFGQPHIQHQGHNLPISRRKSLALLAYLVVTGRSYSRDFLATLFWPENDSSSARNNLRGSLFELKTSLGNQLILIERDEIAIHPHADLWVDVREFQTRVKNARQHNPGHKKSPESPLADDYLSDLIEAAALYSDAFMAGFSLTGSREYEDWQFFMAENLRQMFAEVLRALITWYGTHEEYEPAILYSRRWLGLDPLHEPAQRELMRLYALSGQQAAALRQYQECVRLLDDELGVEPEEETIALYDAIRTRKFTKSSTAETLTPVASLAIGPIRNNLPRLDTPLVGREDELESIVNCFRNSQDCRLLTLSGPGGIGKTSLAIAAASQLVDDPDCPFLDGIFILSLAALSEVDSIIPAIADVLQVPLLAALDERARQLLDYLQTKRLLVILDNFEHLISSQSIRLLVDLLAHARQVKLLVTSRTRLNAHFEHILPLDSLDFPQLDQNIQARPVEQTMSEYSAIRLFAIRARSVKPDFSITVSNIEAVIQICRLVDGLPLGIELATAWLEVLSVTDIVKEITESLDFLEANWPDRPERHHSLRAMFDSSWRLLAEPERAVLMHLALFQGSFSRQAAQAISGASIHILLALQNKSWLQYKNDGRFQIHELLRQYASEKLTEDRTLWQQARQSFANYYASFLDDSGEKIKGPGQESAFNAILVEFENIRLAWQILVENKNIELITEKMLLALYRYVETRAKFPDFKPLLDFAIEAIDQDTGILDNSVQLSILLIARAVFILYGQSYYLMVPPLADQEEAVHRAWDLTGGNIVTIQAMGFWGTLFYYLFSWAVDFQQAIKGLHGLISYFRLHNRRWELANTLNILAKLYMALIDWNKIDLSVSTAVQDELPQLLQEALMIFSELDDRNNRELTREQMGNLFKIQGKYQEAIAYFKIALANLENTGDVTLTGIIVNDLVGAYQDIGDYASAFELLQAIRKRLDEIGYKTGVAVVLSNESLIASRFSSLEHARQTRQESLSEYESVNSAYGVAWATWEMGEIFRLYGDLDGAREWFEKARILFKDIGDRTSSIFYERGLGDIALMTGDYTTALQHFEASLRQARETVHKWGQIYALCGIGRAKVALNEPNAAMEHFSQALQIASLIRIRDMVLLSMAGFAVFFAAINQYELAVELGSMVANHKQTWNETKSQMEALLNAITTLPTNLFDAAQERGRALNIDQAIIRFNL